MQLTQYYNEFFFSSRRRHTRWPRDWSSDVCSSDLLMNFLLLLLKFLLQLCRIMKELLLLVVNRPMGKELFRNLLISTVLRSEERRVGKSVDYGSGSMVKNKKVKTKMSNEYEEREVV